MDGADRANLPHVYNTKLANTPGSEIIKAAQAGLPEAFAELHSVYSHRLYRTILTITKNPEDAEDALQDTFLRAYLALHTFEGRSNIYSWLTRIAINSALIILRKRRNHPEVLVDFLPDAQGNTAGFEIKDPTPNPEQACDLYGRRAKVLRKIRYLAPQLREPIRIQMTQGSSIKEIAQALNISTGAVKTRLHRARLQLSATWEVKCSIPRRTDVA